MVKVGNFWVCGEHPQPIALPVESPTVEHHLMGLCRELPTPIAIPIAEFLKEVARKENKRPFIALWRMVDAAELTTRFFAIIALADIKRQRKEFPEELRKILAQQLSRPSFGSWREIAESALRVLGNSCFVAELPKFWKERWRPLLGSGNEKPEDALIALRNLLAHSAILPEEEARRLLEAHQTRFEQTLQGLDFLRNYLLVASLVVNNRSSVFRLQGLPDPEEWKLPEEDPSALPQLPSKEVCLLSPDRKNFLSLVPLHLYNPILVCREERGFKFEEVDKASPMLYLRYNEHRRILEFTALSQRHSFAQFSGEIWEAFNQLFPLEEWRKEMEQQKARESEWARWGYDFADVIDDLTQRLYGRERHLTDVKNWLKSHRQSGGILWVSGSPGVGKSALMAKLAKDLQGDKNLVVVPFFFRRGDHRCSADHFYRAFALKLSETFRFPLQEKPDQPKSDLFAEAMMKVQENLQGSEKSVVFILDGLDEVVGQNPEIVKLPFRFLMPKIVWICASRKDEQLRELWGSEKVEKLWSDGNLPPLSKDDIRAWLQDELGRLRYELMKRDERTEEGLRNRFIERLTERSEGLPLYVQMVIEDIEAGRWSLNDEDKLPQGLQNYYENLLKRLNISDVGRTITEIVSILCWAKEPMTEKTLAQVVQKLHKTDWSEKVQNALTFGHVMLEQRKTPENDWGWALYHDSFRQHLLQTTTIEGTRKEALDALMRWCGEWKQHESPYALRHLAEHLYDLKRHNELMELARDEEFERVQERVLPNEPDLPRKTVALALDAAIELENPELMAEMLLRHAGKVERIETPMQALRQESLERAIRLAVQKMERDYRIGTLWLLLLSWSCRQKGDVEGSEKCLQEITQWWQGKSLGRLSYWQSEMAVSLLSGLEGEKAAEVALTVLGDKGLRELAGKWAKAGRIEEALKVAERIVYARERSWALKEIAKAMAEAGMTEEARRVFEEALKVAEWIGDAEVRSKALREIAEAMAKVGRFEETLKVAEGIEDARWRSEALSLIAEAMTEAGRFEEALEVAEWIEVAWWRSKALSLIAKAMAEAGRFEGALKVAEWIEDAWRRSWALSLIAKAMAEAGRFEGALEVAEEIEDEWRRSWALREIAEAMAKAGMNEGARRVFEEALKLAEGIEDARERSKVLREIAEAMAKAGRFEEALKATEGIVDAEKRSQVLKKIAEAMAKAGRFEEALKVAERIVVAWLRSWALSEIAETMAEAGMKEEARRVFKEALKAAERIEYARVRSKALSLIAEAMAKAGMMEEAFEEAL
jgi:tetratricopeptide (TPR) repeat protein